jgi:hypothetical protein
MATIGGISSNKGVTSGMLHAATKEDFVKDKQTKDKVTL